MDKKTYIVATIRPWNIDVFKKVISGYPGNWHLVTNPKELTKELIQGLNPRYVFFPHWSNIIPKEILDMAECVCFHETDLPYGRGGSPIQNLIANGHKETMISAIRMVEEIDAGPVYMKRHLSLEGLAEEIYVRASKIIAEMILEMIEKEPMPKEQEGKVTSFKRRTPEQSEIPKDQKELKELFDHIRMLDANEYPRAFIKYGCFRFEITKPSLGESDIKADIRITKISEGDKGKVGNEPDKLK